jgi:hypothetical protein
MIIFNMELHCPRQDQNYTEVPFPKQKQVLEHVCSPLKIATVRACQLYRKKLKCDWRLALQYKLQVLKVNFSFYEASFEHPVVLNINLVCSL